ncbi:MAG: helix-turn-helix transcriptional regulator [Syntrophomonadaceae bacterium]|nr:helix-turn-helix transcriptional regulator [Syntrophomonadaceae bacterium]
MMRNEKMCSLRRAMNLSQREVAEAVGISQSSYAMIEGGYRHPRKEVEKKLADFFNVTVDELFFGEDFSTAGSTEGSGKGKAEGESEQP